jgi:hypothetical protein
MIKFNPPDCSFPVIRIVKNKDLININFFQIEILMYVKSKSSEVVFGTMHRNGILEITGIHSEVIIFSWQSYTVMAEPEGLPLIPNPTIGHNLEPVPFTFSTFSQSPLSPYSLSIILSLPSELLPIGFPTKMLYALLVSS